MIYFEIIFLSICWLIIGWYALDGDLDVESDFLWLVLFGIPVVILIVAGVTFNIIKEKFFK